MDVFGILKPKSAGILDRNIDSHLSLDIIESWISLRIFGLLLPNDCPQPVANPVWPLKDSYGLGRQIGMAFGLKSIGLFIFKRAISFPFDTGCKIKKMK